MIVIRVFWRPDERAAGTSCMRGQSQVSALEPSPPMGTEVPRGFVRGEDAKCEN